jgi:hypothetical protein
MLAEPLGARKLTFLGCLSVYSRSFVRQSSPELQIGSIGQIRLNSFKFD